MKKMLCCFPGFLLLGILSIAQNRYDIVISEIMADPAPPVGLPNYEWIELKNTSNGIINLQGWRLSDESGSSGPLPAYFLRPDSSVVVCSGSALSSLMTFGPAISVSSFPSLDNEGEQILLRSASGFTVHALSYRKDWYKNELKKEGGWSLEMIDPHNPCSGTSNWKASISLQGGTPGKKNSLDAFNADRTAPRLLKTYITDERTIIACFDEPLDSALATNTSFYAVEPGMVVTCLRVMAPLFNKVELKLATELQRRTVYNLRVSNLPDCSGNRMANGIARVGVPEDPVNGEWVINEILFNPASGGADYVEFYNNSDKVLDAQKLYVGNRSSGGMVGSIRALAETPTYIFPKEYTVVTDDSSAVSNQFKVERPDLLFQVSSMPSLPDEEGTVVTLRDQGFVVEELHYDHRWHFRLLREEEGVALERMDPAAPAQDSLNWHSASANSGYGTPTSQNSQYRKAAEANNSFQMDPIVFSPDNDGYMDVANIEYKMEETGFMANVRIYDIEGRPVRYLVRNNLLGYQGHFQWDGLDDNGRQLPMGNYVAITEIFNLSGKTRLFKNLVVIARKFR